ncbi:hypothetical protein MJN51_41225, partial [Salmonella enterica subsp. enterica serovar Kentucky]|nr:hypothetical protein [Salmonella enterica subsp. enterica serovar Kentucky]
MTDTIKIYHNPRCSKSRDTLNLLKSNGVEPEVVLYLDITFPKEGVAPGVQETADAVANLIALGYADQIVLSHDVFLK